MEGARATWGLSPGEPPKARPVLPLKSALDLPAGGQNCVGVCDRTHNATFVIIHGMDIIIINRVGQK